MFKQFTRCTNCRQWYVHTATMPVEVVYGDQCRRLTMWCLRCVAEAEQRSHDIRGHEVAPATSTEPLADSCPREGPPAEFQQLLQEHARLMERALYEEEATLIPLIHHFLQRCRSYQEQSTVPEHLERLHRQCHYWETFLKMLARSAD